MIPSASPPRPPSVRSSASPPRPPCIVVTQFEEKLGETNTPAIPAARAVPGSTAGSRAVPAGAASDGPNGVAARVGVASTNQEESVRVAAHPAVAVRRRAVSPRAAVAADDAVDRICGQQVAAGRSRHFDRDGRPGVAAPAAAPDVSPTTRAAPTVLTYDPHREAAPHFLIVVPKRGGKAGLLVLPPARGAVDRVVPTLHIQSVGLPPHVRGALNRFA